VDRRRLGRTGLDVSPIAFGAFKIGRNRGTKYLHGYDLPDDEAVDRMLNGVLDLGINLIDTAPAYGLSERRIGRALSHRRSEYAISTKAGESFHDGRSTYDFSSSAIRRSVQQSLERLSTDVVDILLLHSNGEDLAILKETDAVETLLDLRSAGLARAVGFSGKTVDGAYAALAWADVLMVEYHLQDRSHEGVVAEAAAADVGILVKKGLASGRLDPAQAVRFVLSNAAVGSLVIGSLSLDHLSDALAAVQRAGA